jgi:multidrug efflux pump subunit AcrA (membrane-fusion protein)
MPKRTAFILTTILLLTALFGGWILSRRIPGWTSGDTRSDTWTVRRTDMEEWIPLSGRLEAASPVTFRTELDGLSKLTYLAEDGAPVLEGDVLARFDDADLRERKRNLQRDRDIADATLTSLREAEHPLELQRIRQDLLQLESDIQKESLLETETRALVEEGLLAPEELDLYNQNLTALRTRKQAIQEQQRLTEDVLHPAALRIAQARLNAAEAGLQEAERELASTVIRAPASVTVHLPVIPIDGERRPPRVGDGLYRNQVVLQVADLNDLVIRAEIGERLLARVVPGMQAMVQLPAFPDIQEPAVVTSVGAYPRGARRRYPVELQWKNPPADLRPGLSAEIEVLSRRHENVLTVPRDYLDWQGSTLFVHTSAGRQEVEPGRGNDQVIILQSGIREGEELVRP